jgi:flagellin
MAVFQDTNDDGSFKVEAKTAGTAWDGFRVQIKDSAGMSNDYVTWDANTKVITVAVDLGNANGNSARAVDLINSDPIVGKYFTASLFGTSGANIDSAADTYSRYSTGGQAYSGITVHLATDANGVATTTAAQLVSYIESGPNPFTDLGISATNAQGSNGAGRLAATTSAIQWHTVGETMTNDFAQAVTYNRYGSNAQLRIKARTAGSAYQDVRVVFTDVGGGNPNTFAYDATTKTLTIGVDDGVDTAADLIAAYTANGSASSSVYPLFDIQAIGTDPSDATTGLLSTADGARLGAGNTADGAVKGVRNTGNSYGAYLLGNVDVGDVIGADGVKFKAVDYGLAAFVSIKSLSGTFTVTDTSGTAKERAYGTDVNARINGIQAVGKGLQASINTATLDMSLTLSSNSSYVTAGTTINFTIKSGGAQFQIGPEVVSNQQTRLGLTSMSTATLGTSAGRLYQLRSGGNADLDTDVNLAASIVEGVVSQVTTFRGRIGAFQKTTLDTNIKALTDTVETLTDAESSIRDADFAAETAAMTRAQILVQSGLSVLTIANNNPQNVLALLRG